MARRSFPLALGASPSQAEGHQSPDVSYGDDLSPGRNAFAWNRKAPMGINFKVNMPGARVSAIDNQWEHCGSGAVCDKSSIEDPTTGDIRLAEGSSI